ncbi:MAG TPA: protein kinase [Polyangiaceae bacterium LLY-WYZ-15_(1-7)]|nr:protein kinase [Polyangiaceae bacterium LLY-WYZ-15_(1-7)]HJL13330.1 protein kinase [Polyangiaceae bacterium LLY-WYZ-15_(1-7)]
MSEADDPTPPPRDPPEEGVTASGEIRRSEGSSSPQESGEVRRRRGIPSPRESAELEALHAPRVIERRAVGNYDVVASLGRGGAGEVFLAIARGPHRFRKLVVLKMLHSHFAEDPSVVAMFLDEARLAARLEHPNIVQTLEVGVHEDRHFLAMAYLEGLPLDRILARFGQRDEQLPVTIAVRIAIEVLEGLAYAHGLGDYDGTPLGIVHRDISPANVFVCWDGSVKILDFGIAKAATRRANTDSGIIKGKFGYIAPEQAKGEELDARADVWSVGVVLWEMLTSRRLFPAMNDVTTLQALVADELRDVRDYAPDAPAPVVAVLERALKKDPEQRYASADAMKAELEAWLATVGERASRDDVAATLGDLFAGEREQHQAMIRECVGGARLGSTPSGFFHVDADGSRSFRTAPPPPPAQGLPRGPLLLALLALVALLAIVAGSALVPAWNGESAPGEAGGSEAGASEAGGSEAEGSGAGETGAGEMGAGETGAEQGESGNAGGEREREDTERGTAGRGAAGGSTESSTAGSTEASTGAPEADEAARSAGADDSAADDSAGTGTPGRRASEVGEPGPRDEAAPPTPGPSQRRVAGATATEAEAGEAPEDESVDESEAAAATGLLTLDTTPWTVVELDGRTLGHTPLVRVEVPAGEVELTLRNPERGLVRSYVVQVPAGGAIRRRLGLE